MFILKETSSNAYNNDSGDEQFQKNFFKYFSIRLPHAETIDDALRALHPEELELLKMHLVSGLIEQKIFRKFHF
jgi:hypothetical protein